MTEEHGPAEGDAVASDHPIAKASDRQTTSFSVRRRMTWVWTVLLNSSAMVISILLALGVDQWAENEDKKELAQKSLASFALEIEQNRARLEDLSPFHRGIRDVLLKLEEEGEVRTMAQLRDVVGFEPLRPPFLTDVAWETAVATGSLTYMDFDIVSALSLTYTLQHRFLDDVRMTLPNMVRAETVSESDVRDLVRFLAFYLTDVIEGEENLRAVYRQALDLIGGLTADPSTSGPAISAADTPDPWAVCRQCAGLSFRARLQPRA